MARCWLCGGTLRSGDRGVCPCCIDSVTGLCGRCPARSSCEDMYRRVMGDRSRRGLDPPRYPPCTSRPVADVHSRLVRVQADTYGLPIVGVVVLLLAAGDLRSDDESLRSVEWSDQVQALALAWGARWSDAA